MSFFFQKDAFDSKGIFNSIVTVSIDPDLHVLKFDVDLDSLPFEDAWNGYEVVTQFHLPNMGRNYGAFYTDSNGLDMQLRILNFRATWDFHPGDDYMNENVTQNYYPVNSAIYVEDESIRLTVNNDRS